MRRTTTIFPWLVAFITSAVLMVGCSTESVPERTSLRLHFSRKSLKPASDSLYAIYPNPYNRLEGDTVLNITFAVIDSGAASVLIQNVLGDEIAGYQDTVVPPGVYSGTWNPIGSNGNPLMAGLYFVTLRTNTYINSRLVNIQSND